MQPGMPTKVRMAMMARAAWARTATMRGAAAWARTGAARAMAPAVALIVALAASTIAPALATNPADDDRTIAALRAAAIPIRNRASDYDALLARIGGARIVLLGEDTHGTREHYEERAQITQRLIAEHGFSGVVIEADWTETLALRDAVAGDGPRSSVDAAFASFVRFPRWMWSNPTFRAFAHTMRESNDGRASGTPPATIHGMDLYDVQGSATAVIEALQAIDTSVAERARSSYACLESSDRGGDGLTRIKSPRWPDVDCASAVIAPLVDLVTGAIAALDASPNNAHHFDLVQHARNVAAGEAYLRAMHEGREDSWDIRDRHMASTIDFLLSALDNTHPRKRSRLVVWAHNAHVGDMGATSRAIAGRVSIGQLLRERYPGDVAIVGLMTAVGSVRAAVEWGGPDHVMQLTPPRRGSHADLFRRTRIPAFTIMLETLEKPNMKGAKTASSANNPDSSIAHPRWQRGIGVRYVKSLERPGGHYYEARLDRQYDAVIFIERTRALPCPRRMPGQARRCYH